MPTSTAEKYIQLSFHDTGRRVVVHPENNDRFVLSAREAAIACQSHNAIENFVDQFEKLLNRMGTWVEKHSQDVQTSFVTVRDGGLLFLVIRKSVAFDQDLQDSLVDLDLAIAQDSEFDQINLNVLALPNTTEESYRTFLVPGCTWVYAN